MFGNKEKRSRSFSGAWMDQIPSSLYLVRVRLGVYRPNLGGKVDAERVSEET